MVVRARPERCRRKRVFNGGGEHRLGMRDDSGGDGSGCLEKKGKSVR